MVRVDKLNTVIKCFIKNCINSSIKTRNNESYRCFFLIISDLLFCLIISKFICNSCYGFEIAGNFKTNETSESTSIYTINSNTNSSIDNNDDVFDSLCPKVNIFSNLQKSIPLHELSPTMIGGQQMSRSLSIPDEANKSNTCSCTDEFGVKNIGLSIGRWEIAYLVEVVPNSNCSLVFGTKINFNKEATPIGLNGNLSNTGKSIGFYQVHLYSFPLTTMMSWLTDTQCGIQEYMDLDLLYASELDPSWNDEQKALALNPETKYIANKNSVASCVIDSSLAYRKEPLEDKLFYCMGAWGFMYPLAGYSTNVGTTANTISLTATKVLYLLHKRGLLRNTFGAENMCTSGNIGKMHKNTYRFSMLYPMAESSGTHGLGSPSEYWDGDLRLANANNGAIFVVWRYRDCCLMSK